MIQIKPEKKQSGFALLMTIIVLSVVISVTLAMVDLSLKQLQLASDSTGSEIAFHAANAGLECARYTRNFDAADFDVGNTVRFDCFGSGYNVPVGVPSIVIKKNSPGFGTPATLGTDASVFTYTTAISWGDPTSRRCSEMTILTIIATTTVKVGSSNPSTNSIKNLIPTYGSDYKICEGGAVCSIVAVTGYSSTCSGSATSSPSTLKREILLEF